MANRYKLGKYNTAIVTNQNGFQVFYYDTPVVTVKTGGGGVVILNTGGWFTTSTRNRMNQAAYQFRLGYYVFQKGCKWFVRDRNGNVTPFQNELAIA